jgi:hypothetical protein
VALPNGDSAVAARVPAWTDPLDFRLGWSPSARLAQTAWLRWGRALSATPQPSPWALGDWLAFGQRRWHASYAEARAVTGYRVQSLRNMVHVASRFAPERRRGSVSWTAHAVLAALTRDNQEGWLDRVERDQLSVRSLQRALRARDRGSLVGGTRSRAEHDPARCPRCGAALSGEVHQLQRLSA